VTDLLVKYPEKISALPNDAKSISRKCGEAIVGRNLAIARTEIVWVKP